MCCFSDEGAKRIKVDEDELTAVNDETTILNQQHDDEPMEGEEVRQDYISIQYMYFCHNSWTQDSYP